MTTENIKKLVKLTMYLDSDKHFEYEGRLLGLIDDAEFNILVRNKTVQTRCISKQTIPLTNITLAEEYGGLEGLKGLRLVLAIKKKEGANCYTKALFVSNKLSWISYIDKNSASINSDDHSWMVIEERGV